MRGPVSCRANMPRTRSCPRFRPGSKPAAAGRRPHLLRLLEASLLSFFQTHVVGTKAYAVFTTSRPPPGREDAPQGRDEEIGDVAAYAS